MVKTPQSSSNTSDDFLFWPTRIPPNGAYYAGRDFRFEDDDLHKLTQSSGLVNNLTEKVNGNFVNEPIYYEPLSPTSQTRPSDDFGVSKPTTTTTSRHIYDHLVMKKCEIVSVKSKQGSLTSSDDGSLISQRSSSDHQNSGKTF